MDGSLPAPPFTEEAEFAFASKLEAEPSAYKDLELEPRGGVEVKSKGNGAPRHE